MVETTSMLKVFEKDCMDTYISHEKKEKDESFDARLALLEKKLVATKITIQVSL